MKTAETERVKPLRLRNSGTNTKNPSISVISSSMTSLNAKVVDVRPFSDRGAVRLEPIHNSPFTKPDYTPSPSLSSRGELAVTPKLRKSRTGIEDKFGSAVRPKELQKENDAKGKLEGRNGGRSTFGMKSGSV